jgi:hypothetical protein
MLGGSLATAARASAAFANSYSTAGSAFVTSVHAIAGCIYFWTMCVDQWREVCRKPELSGKIW